MKRAPFEYGTRLSVHEALGTVRANVAKIAVGNL